MITHTWKSWLKTWFYSKPKTKKAKKDEKLIFQENADLHKPYKKNNDHTRILRKVRFRSSFNKK